ncbi:MAG: hypothetical protein COW65_14530 [Cytophagales bacterium CG18_big_fil_WC_8_21_14_2_50_42_9]|nr:MAG: hypothetical protein COW65_14530 [Cytophagales bacterium CG18_big_fil_WC_8_21_14_2_50_42_9]
MIKFYFFLFLFPVLPNYLRTVPLSTNYIFWPVIMQIITQNTGETISGKILDAKTGMPVPYASIQLLATNTGTISDTAGQFILVLKAEHQRNLVQISAIGYKTRAIEAAKLLATSSEGKVIVNLMPVSAPLNEVQVKAKPQKFALKKVGSQIDKFTSFHHVFKSYVEKVDTTEGPEIGIPIYFKKYPAYLQNLNFCLTGSGAEETILSFKLYYLKNNLPAKRLNAQNIILKIPPQHTGWIEIDLKPYNISLQQDFMVALEWIKDGEQKEKAWLASPALVKPKEPVFYKRANQANWRKLESTTVGMYVTLLYSK